MVEHSIGNAEVDSSILSGSTILSNKINIFANALKIAVGSKCRTMQENASRREALVSEQVVARQFDSEFDEMQLKAAEDVPTRGKGVVRRLSVQIRNWMPHAVLVACVAIAGTRRHGR
jgi:hypothetical protein